ncbi:MAG: M50 family metallopeptidase, partial [Fimbriimonadaceae bacterium]|nr:M50 family metallopeptidase [Fimbriimonadaceae bacterium]
GEPFRIASQTAGMEGGGDDREVMVVEKPGGYALREETNFTIRAWPLGGFVRIKGMIPQENAAETHVIGGFYSRPAWQRFLVLLAGPLFSILFGILLFIPAEMITGKEKPSNEPVLGQMAAKGPADVAGLKLGDRVRAIDGQPINTFYEIVRAVRTKAGKTLTFVIERDGVRFEKTVMPESDRSPSPVLAPDLSDTGDRAIQGKIGIGMNVVRVPVTFAEATAQAFSFPGMAVSNILKMFTDVRRFEENMGGPATMYNYTRLAAQSGLGYVVKLAALLSISVGIFNLLPIYPLDGGQMVVAVIEMFRRGRRLSLRVQEAIGNVGFALVLMLFVSVLVVDARRFMYRGEPRLVAPTPKTAPNATPKASSEPSAPAANPTADPNSAGQDK